MRAREQPDGCKTENDSATYCNRISDWKRFNDVYFYLLLDALREKLDISWTKRFYRCIRKLLAYCNLVRDTMHAQSNCFAGDCESVNAWPSCVIGVEVSGSSVACFPTSRSNCNRGRPTERWCFRHRRPSTMSFCPSGTFADICRSPKNLISLVESRFRIIDFGESATCCDVLVACVLVCVYVCVTLKCEWTRHYLFSHSPTLIILGRRLSADDLTKKDWSVLLYSCIQS